MSFWILCRSRVCPIRNPFSGIRVWVRWTPIRLAETTMDPRHRMLRRIRIEDAEAAERAFSLLMGSEVAPRKEFIIAGAHQLDTETSICSLRGVCDWRVTIQEFCVRIVTLIL